MKMDAEMTDRAVAALRAKYPQLTAIRKRIDNKDGSVDFLCLDACLDLVTIHCKCKAKKKDEEKA